MFSKKLLPLLSVLLFSPQLWAASQFWGKPWGDADHTFQSSGDVLLAKRLDAPPNDLTTLFPRSAYHVFSIDLDQDGTSDFIVESRTKKQTCFVKSDLSIKRCESLNHALRDGFAYEFFISRGRGQMLMLLDLSGSEDDSDYALKTFDPKTWKLKKITEIYPLIESDRRDKKGIYYGYPWDIGSLPTKSVDGETAIRVTFDHNIDEEPFMGSSSHDTTKGPAILFKGKATQGGPRGDYDQLRNQLDFLPLTRVIQAALAGPLLTKSGIKIYPKYDGHGEAWSLSMRTQPHNGPSEKIIADLTVGTRGCSGSFTGVGTIQGNVARLRSKDSDGSDQCEVTLSFQDGGAKVNVHETNCLHRHGRSCEFSGTLTKN